MSDQDHYEVPSDYEEEPPENGKASEPTATTAISARSKTVTEGFDDEVSNFFGNGEPVTSHQLQDSSLPSSSEIRNRPNSGERGATIQHEPGTTKISRAVSTSPLSASPEAKQQVPDRPAPESHDSSRSSSPREIIRQPEPVVTQKKAKLQKSQTVMDDSEPEDLAMRIPVPDVIKNSVKQNSVKQRQSSKTVAKTISATQPNVPLKPPLKQRTKKIATKAVTQKNQKSEPPNQKPLQVKKEVSRPNSTKSIATPLLSVMDSQLNSTFVVNRPPSNKQREKADEKVPLVADRPQFDNRPARYKKSLNSTFTIEPSPSPPPPVDLRARWKSVHVPRFRSANRMPPKNKVPVRALSAAVNAQLRRASPDREISNTSILVDAEDNPGYDSDLQPIVDFTVKDSKHAPGESYWNYLLEHPDMVVRAQSPDLQSTHPKRRSRPMSRDLLEYDRILTETRTKTPVRLPSETPSSRSHGKSHVLRNVVSDDTGPDLALTNQPYTNKNADVVRPVGKENASPFLQTKDSALTIRKEVMLQLSKINDYRPDSLKQVLLDSFEMYNSRRAQHGLNATQISSILTSVFNELVQV